MKTLCLLLLSLLATQSHAAQQKGYILNTEFEYRVQGKIAKAQSTFILDADNQAWTSLTEPKEGVALLGRVVAKDAKSLHIEYIVIDTTKRHSVISTPAMVARLGEPANLEVTQKGGDKIKVSVLARPTEYSSK